MSLVYVGMAQTLNTSFYRGATRPQIIEAFTPSAVLRREDEIQGIRVTLEENERFLSPVLLNTGTSIEDAQNQFKQIIQNNIKQHDA